MHFSLVPLVTRHLSVDPREISSLPSETTRVDDPYAGDNGVLSICYSVPLSKDPFWWTPGPGTTTVRGGSRLPFVEVEGPGGSWKDGTGTFLDSQPRSSNIIRQERKHISL